MNNIDIVIVEIHKRICHLQSIINSCTKDTQLSQLPEYMIQLKRQILFIIEKYKKQTNLFERSAYMKTCTIRLESFVKIFWDVYVKKVKQLN